MGFMRIVPENRSTRAGGKTSLLVVGALVFLVGAGGILLDLLPQAWDPIALAIIGVTLILLLMVVEILDHPPKSN